MITHEQAELAIKAMCALAANGADNVGIKKGCEALLDAIETINQRLCRHSDSCEQESVADRTAR